MYRILKSELNNTAKFKDKFYEYVQNLQNIIDKEANVYLNQEELSDLLLSACRANEFNIIEFQGRNSFVNEDNVLRWINEKLIPNTIILNLDDPDVVRLLLFCIEITYQMFEGGTKATTTQKGFRDRRRTFESILSDQFVGKLGEVIVKKLLEMKYNIQILLDWDISTQIERYRSDIVNASKRVSIKSSPSLAGIWAEADIGYDYGITVKCSVPQPTILQFFVEVCGFLKLLDFADARIPSDDERFKGYIQEMRKRIRGYKCGEIQTSLKGFVCGYFDTHEYKPVSKGVELPYLGEVREERYLIKISQLKYTDEDWNKFLYCIGILN
ncbi:TPA: hypothetical protein ENX78_06485 [Candidatus Poribacteria bacterium]|nr:hypothetical protein [Candidatus Poribacteria bacterium]